MGDLFARLGGTYAGERALRHMPARAHLQLTREQAAHVLPLALGQHRIVKTALTQLEGHDPVEDLLAIRRRGSPPVAAGKEQQQHHEDASPHRVNLTRIGGDSLRIAWPSRSRAGTYCACMAQATAAGPKPCPGSETTLAVMAAPSLPTTT